MELSQNRGIRAATAAAFLVLASGCAAVPVEDRVVEQLDERTGTTLVRVDRPLELVATRVRNANADPFAYVAPFEVNRMGARRMYLWVAVPEGGRDVPPVVSIDDAALSLGATARRPGDVGLDEWPHAAPAPWSRLWAFEMDAATLARLRGGSRLTVAMPLADGAIEFQADRSPRELMDEFARRVGLP